jgi:hypothetical protein
MKSQLVTVLSGRGTCMESLLVTVLSGRGDMHGVSTGDCAVR